MMRKKTGICGAAALASLMAMSWTPSAVAGSVTCPTPGDTDTSGKTYMTLSVPDAITASCYDFGTTGTSKQYSVDFTGQTVVQNNLILELPTNSVENNLASYLKGETAAGTSGSFEILLDADRPFWLVFKTGGGQNDPYWFAFQLSKLIDGETLSWNVFSGTDKNPNALSNTRLFSGQRIPDEPPPPPVPEPGTLALLGLGLLGLGASRTRKAQSN